MGYRPLMSDGRPQDDVILCADDVSHECHLKCSGITAGSANSMHWRCPACDQKKCQELSLQENDLTSPWVGLEAHRLVRELVKGLQREYKQLLVSGQRIDENTHDVTLSHADACELYGKAVFWEGASADLTARGRRRVTLLPTRSRRSGRLAAKAQIDLVISFW